VLEIGGIWFVYVYNANMRDEKFIGELDDRKSVVGSTEAAAFLGVSVIHLQRMVGKGVLPAKRCGHLLKFRAGDLYDLWDSWPKALTFKKRKEQNRE